MINYVLFVFKELWGLNWISTWGTIVDIYNNGDVTDFTHCSICTKTFLLQMAESHEISGETEMLEQH